MSWTFLWKLLVFLLESRWVWGSLTRRMMKVCLCVPALLFVDSLPISLPTDYPSPKTFKENLKVTVHGVELEVPVLTMLEDFEVYGTWDLKEELFCPPPMMDLRPFLEPW